MATTVFFGAIEEEILAVHALTPLTLDDMSGVAPQQTVEPIVQPTGDCTMAVVVETPKEKQDVFADLLAKTNARMEAAGPQIVYKRRGCYVTRSMTAEEIASRERSEQIRLAMEELEPKLDHDHVVDHIWVDEIETEPQPVIKRPIHCTPSQRIRSAPAKIITKNAAGIDNIVRSIKHICAKRDIVLELVARKRKSNYVVFNKYKGRVVTHAVVAHMLQRRRAIDFHENAVLKRFSHIFTTKWSEGDVATMGPGTSGMIISVDGYTHTPSGSIVDYFIMRGKIGGHYIDARSKLSASDLKHIKEFSNGDLFWRGFSDKFLSHKPHIDHHCESNLKVTDCGEVAGLVTQAMHPCGKITCKQCITQLRHLTRLEYGEVVCDKIDEVVKTIQESYDDFGHIINILQAVKRALTLDNNNIEACSEIYKLIGDRTTEPFINVQRINTTLLKCGTASSSEFADASADLLKVAQYLKNRTDVIASNDIKHFRNKRSSKTYFNADLLCDNQLDKNGNFVWGERGYHAKRFLNNFFTLVDPADGYNKHVIRHNRRGSRKLAIGKLIVSTNLAAFRSQMRGEVAQVCGVTDECICRRNGSYYYPGCCITNEDGSPLESELELPTKHHLVVGNMGEPKYVGLPQDPEMKMYISKDGYCYINIFFAMLINVSENEAKAFTKMVRDIIIPKLGEWPSVVDVATACNLLSIFYPDTRSAELPRMLVDHVTRTIHVLDSFGSISTGYHILKANTVNQFMQLAQDSVVAPIKDYSVGGLPMGDVSASASISLLIKSVYKPRVMQQIIMSEPYVLIMALVSPSLLIALFNSGSLEMATHIWIRKSQSITQIMMLLSILAAKVSFAKTLRVQLALIEENAGMLLNTIDSTFEPYHSINAAQALLCKLIETRSANEDLVIQGFEAFRKSTLELTEKSYVIQLEDSWGALSWSEKCCVMWHSRKLQRAYSQYKELRNEAGLSARCATSVTASLGIVKHRSEEKLRVLKRRVKDSVRRIIGKVVCKCVNGIKYAFPDILALVNTLIVISLILGISTSLHHIAVGYMQMKQHAQEEEDEKKMRIILRIHAALKMKLGELPTFDEFQEYLDDVNPELGEWFRNEYNQDKYQFQQKSDGLKNLEKIVAFTALVVMLVDAERSDGVFKIMNKIKGIISTATQDPMRFQSLDDIRDTLVEKNQTIDFDLDGESPQICRYKGVEFETWWNNQLVNNNVIPHYRTEGRFVEFTRATAALVANEIAHGTHKDILIRGAVGSGKSTGLPFHLSSRGRVLLIEPTKPLAENVCKQLRKEPFNVSPTLRMRGTTIFGSTPITVMTSGFALHYYANNVAELRNLSFIIFDECHVHDANAMAFRCLLSEYTYDGTIIKMSATPPGRETEFTTQKAVKLRVEENLSHSQFVQQLGTGANSDVLQDGDNILVYVASYNEVDSLSKMLIESGHKVTKVDGRTMKNGCTEIETMGTKEKKHFIVATNIIENGVTLDIDVVVDFGCKVTPELDVDARMVRYRKVSISYGERIQRLGRVGRHKDGTALRIGATEKGLQKVPEMVATEAAFYCFAYGLPVMTEGVTTSLLAHCTVLQARSMLQFEISIFFMFYFVRYDGSMHPAIHDKLKQYKLRDSEILLQGIAIPSQSVKSWPTVREYHLQGQRLDLDDDVRLPFYARDIPERLIKDLYTITMVHKNDAGFGRLTSVSAAKIAYTLQTDPMSVQRTILIIDKLIEKELTKQAYFANITSSSCSSSNFTLTSIVNAIRARHVTDHTTENIIRLQAAKGQLLEFKNINADLTKLSSFDGLEALETLTFQSEEDVSKALNLQGHWNSSLVTSDVIVVGSVLIGGAYLIYKRFKQYVSAPYEFQGKSKRHRQKIGFRDARDMKYAREVYGDDACIEQHFGSAYTKKGKGKGTTRGMGSKSRRFYNMYGFDPTDYTFARYVDPLTGKTLDEQTLTDITLVQSHFGNIRQKYVNEGLLDISALNKGIEAYFVKDGAKQLLKIDLTPHNPLQVGRQTASIAGHPDRDGELRQTGPSQMLPLDKLPSSDEEEATFETKSTFNGVRDYNSISSVICRMKNSSDGYDAEVHGIGYGSVIITNQHLFKRNNGELRVWSHHGEFLVKNTTELKVYPVEGRDIMLVRMPKDFPPFPRKIRFRRVQSGERVVLVGSNFQDKFISSVVSESSVTSQSTTDSFVKHWISTKEGHCGLPLVSPKDGYIVGIHSLASTVSSTNMFTGFTDEFENEILSNIDTLAWTKNWRLNVDLANWGVINIKRSHPSEEFHPAKECTELDERTWQFQHKSAWLLEKLTGNLRPVANLESALVTKHVVKGKCPLFHLYLELVPEAKAYFTPLMGAYQKSLLNKEAYMKDLFKYAGPVIVGDINSQIFETCLTQVIQMLEEKGMTQCEYVTDETTIFQALNMKAAVGALYRGKKREYFDNYTDEMKETILRASCFRLYTGRMGIWNGSLKAELRSAEKVAQNKTRTFTAAPIDTLLGGKVCVDDFNNKFYELNNKIPSSVGMTKFYGGWDNMLNSFPDGWILCDADGSQFDSSLSPYLINAVLQIRLHFNEDWDIGEQMLRNLYTEIIYTPISTPDGTVIKKFKGNNSGQPSTVVDNTLMVILSVYYAIRLAGCNDDISEYIKFVVNGDDLLIAVRPDKEWLLDTFTSAFKSLGLNYDFTNRHANKEDVWFMSHRGIKRNGVYIPKLEEERIVSILEWDRANEPAHRLEALCAAMIEAWGYDELLDHIRKFYYWLLCQAPYSELSAQGKAPFISEVALTALYTGEDATDSELERYLKMFNSLGVEKYDDEFTFQSESTSSEVDAGRNVQRRSQSEPTQMVAQPQDQDVNVGTTGTYTIPRIKTMTAKLNLPKVKGKAVVNLEHLLIYDPDQTDISNTRSSHAQFSTWYESVKNEYGVDDQQMQIVLNGLMVWCIENGTSPNINGTWTMMDGTEQVEYPLRPIIAHAQPTLRQIMAHFSSLAEAYIEKRNLTKPYMPRYGLQRNLNDISLARYAFDFYELTSKTPSRAREAHMQMKAAALQNAKPKLFGLDGNVGTTDEDTERHIATDVNRHMHSMLGVRMQ
ncbi:ORF1 [Iris potyvirus A]|nr:ORF1 [Iris potyvirus A]